MSETLTKDDLRQFGQVLIDNIRKIFDDKECNKKNLLEPEWLRSKAVRKLLDISAGSVQNLRTADKVRFKKVQGSYYYNKEDILNLFKDE